MFITAADANQNRWLISMSIQTYVEDGVQTISVGVYLKIIKVRCPLWVESFPELEYCIKRESQLSPSICHCFVTRIQFDWAPTAVTSQWAVNWTKGLFCWVARVSAFNEGNRNVTHNPSNKRLLHWQHCSESQSSAALPPGCDPRTVFANIPGFYAVI